jgi:hypothetical protein
MGIAVGMSQILQRWRISDLPRVGKFLVESIVCVFLSFVFFERVLATGRGLISNSVFFSFLQYIRITMVSMMVVLIVRVDSMAVMVNFVCLLMPMLISN